MVRVKGLAFEVRVTNCNKGETTEGEEEEEAETVTEETAEVVAEAAKEEEAVVVVTAELTTDLDKVVRAALGKETFRLVVVVDAIDIDIW